MTFFVAAKGLMLSAEERQIFLNFFKKAVVHVSRLHHGSAASIWFSAAHRPWCLVYLSSTASDIFPMIHLQSRQM